MFSSLTKIIEQEEIVRRKTHKNVLKLLLGILSLAKFHGFLIIFDACDRRIVLITSI
jgi:hypothetical protein